MTPVQSEHAGYQALGLAQKHAEEQQHQAEEQQQQAEEQQRHAEERTRETNFDQHIAACHSLLCEPL
jgi:hypothetical protein